MIILGKDYKINSKMYDKMIVELYTVYVNSLNLKIIILKAKSFNLTEKNVLNRC